VNRGSRFTVSLPWSQPAAVGTRALQTTTALPSLGQGQLILLAEDSELAIPPLTVYLQTRGYRVAVARNGQEALDLAFEECPALILMDVQMPQMDGLEATRQLRARPQTAQVPIIALTALAMPGDRERCLAAGANDYLPKPVSLSILVQKINHWVAAKGLLATNAP
jgi:CheY-like chemotaxis protein